MSALLTELTLPEKFRHIFLCMAWVVCVLLPHPAIADDGVIRSAVSPEYIDGLHAKYLKHLATKMDMSLELQPMSFARRIQALRKGELDILVGLQRRNETQDEFIYMHPSYESLSHTFFILNSNKPKLKRFNDLKQLNIGITSHAKYFKKLHDMPDLAIVGVNSLSQKIQLLQNGRIDTFIHYRESTLPTLEQRGLLQSIVIADYQPEEINAYYFALSEHSPLVTRREQLEKVIKAATENGEFSQIRQLHYSQ